MTGDNSDRAFRAAFGSNSPMTYDDAMSFRNDEFPHD